MDNFYYIVFSILDAFVTLALMFRLFRFPVREYIPEFIKISLIITAVSYVNRMILHISLLDPFIQTIVFVLLLRYITEIKYIPSVIITIQGYSGFIMLQVVMTFFLTWIGFIQPGDLSQNTGVKVYVIQVLGQITTVAAAYLLYVFNLGFSIFIRPPHEFSIKNTLDKKKFAILSASIIMNCLICGSFYFWLHIHSPLFIVLPLTLVAFGLIYWLTHRKEYAAVDH